MVLRLPDSWLNWNLEILIFEVKGKQEYPEKNLSKQRREPTANSTHRWGRTKYQILVFLTKECSNYFNQSRRFTPQDPTFTVLCTSLSSTTSRCQGGSITGHRRAAEIEPNTSSKFASIIKEQALSAKGFFLTETNRLHD